MCLLPLERGLGAYGAGVEQPPRVMDGFDALRDWSLDGDWVFLNAGSFGLRFREVLAARAAVLEQFEQQPVDFLERYAPTAIEESRRVVADFVGADVDGLACVTNATEAIDAVLVGLRKRPGDLLVTSESYGGVFQACHWEARHANHRNVRVVEQPLPASCSQDIVAAWTEQLQQGNVVLAIVDHIASPTAVVQPVEAIIRACREANVQVLVDGAHAPGMLPLKIEAIGADWYAGNLHKWVGAPSGAGFLWTAPEYRDTTRPVIASHNVHDGYIDSFNWQGTRDITPWLVVHTAIAAIDRRGGWASLQAWQSAMCQWCGPILAEAMGTTLAAPPDAPCGAMVAAQVPPETVAHYGDRFVFRDEIAQRHHVEVAISDVGDTWWVRLSMGPWLTPADVTFGIGAVKDCLQ